MSGKISSLLVLFLFTTAGLAGAEGPPPASQEAIPGVLLLRNGQVIEGHIERNGDYYTVTAPDQEIEIHVASVEFLCRDLRDGYQRKKAAIQPNDVQQHLDLLLWCERHGLLDCARAELDTVETIDRGHPMIAVLRRRLKIESQQKAEPPRPAGKVEPPPSDEILNHMTRGMPPGTVELFVQVVQPILLNHYPGASGYILPDNKSLQLMRPSLGETPSRRITQRNLYAVLQCIDLDNPGESPMLKVSIGPAAGKAAAAFPGRYSTQYQKLLQWVYLVAQKPMPAEEPGGVENASFADLATGESSPAVNRSLPHIRYFPSADHGKEKPTAEPDATADPAAGRKPKAKSNSDAAAGDHAPRRSPANRAAAAAIDSVDPYDPATFNNQANAPTELPTPAARVLHGQ